MRPNVTTGGGPPCTLSSPIGNILALTLLPSNRGTGPRDGTAGGETRSVACAALELIGVVGEEHVEAGQRAIASAHVGLQLHLHILWQVRRVHLLFERAKAISQHHPLVKEGADRPALLLKARGCRTQHQRAAPP